jgi:hypothetical protein
LICAFVACLVLVPSAYGQVTCVNSAEVGCVIPNLFGSSGSTGITLPSGFHSAHFLDPVRFTENFLPLNTAVATQLTLLPLPSPASGFVYELNPATGQRVPRTETLGPILTERGETIGARKLFVGFAWQRFNFKEIDGQKLNTLPAVFTHQEGTGPGGTSPPYELDVITVSNDFNLKINQFTVFGSVGVTDRLDISAAVPIMDVSLTANALATINRVTGALCAPPGQPATDPCHSFDPSQPVTSVSAPYQRSSSASGIGDMTLRFKYNIFNSQRVSTAILTDVRFPTGDERNFLGSGSTGVKPFVAISWRAQRVMPHINVGFQWNGDSQLGGNLGTGAKGPLPDQFFYSVGTEVGVRSNFTVSADLVGQRLFDGVRVTSQPLTTAGGTYDRLAFPTANFGINNASLGAKYTFANRFLLTGNALIAIDEGGLRQPVTPLIGLSVLF